MDHLHNLEVNIAVKTASRFGRTVRDSRKSLITAFVGRQQGFHSRDFVTSAVDLASTPLDLSLFPGIGNQRKASCQGRISDSHNSLLSLLGSPVLCGAHINPVDIVLPRSPGSGVDEFTSGESWVRTFTLQILDEDVFLHGHICRGTGTASKFDHISEIVVSLVDILAFLRYLSVQRTNRTRLHKLVHTSSRQECWDIGDFLWNRGDRQNLCFSVKSLRGNSGGIKYFDRCRNIIVRYILVEIDNLDDVEFFGNIAQLTRALEILHIERKHHRDIYALSGCSIVAGIHVEIKLRRISQVSIQSKTEIKDIRKLFYRGKHRGRFLLPRNGDRGFWDGTGWILCHAILNERNDIICRDSAQNTDLPKYVPHDVGRLILNDPHRCYARSCDGLKSRSHLENLRNLLSFDLEDGFLVIIDCFFNSLDLHDTTRLVDRDPGVRDKSLLIGWRGEGD